MNIEQLKNFNIFKDEIKSLELLKNQGFNNISYFLKTSTKTYILRVFKSKQSVNISREFEYKIQKEAYKKGISSKVLFFSENFMIYEFIEGLHKSKLQTVDIKNLALKLKKIHKIKAKTKIYNLKNDLIKYEKTLKDSQSKKLIKESNKSLLSLKTYKKDLVLNHHDLNPKNIIFKNQNIKIIDWEYSGLNDRFFDLASLCIEFSLNKKREELFLKFYFKNYSNTQKDKLKLFKTIYINICKLWFKMN